MKGKKGEEVEGRMWWKQKLERGGEKRLKVLWKEEKKRKERKEKRSWKEDEEETEL